VCVCVCAQSDQLKMVKATEFKFDVDVPRDSPDMVPQKFGKGALLGLHEPLNVWLLNTNSSEMVRATDFKFDKHVPRDRLDMTP